MSKKFLNPTTNILKPITFIQNPTSHVSRPITHRAFTVWEMILTLSMMSLLSLVLFIVANPAGIAVDASRVTDEFVLKAFQRAILVYETDHPEADTLLPAEAQPGFYLICNQSAKNCPGKKGKYINLNILVEEEYLIRIPNHSEYSNAQISGYVFHYDKTKHPPIIMTYGEWETIGRPI